MGRQRIRPRAMKRRALATFADIHSHDTAAATSGNTVVNITPGETIDPDGWYSIGIHPWSTASGPPSFATLRRLVADARRNNVVAIGECGFDTLRGGDIDLQQQVFDFQAKLARRLGLPLVIHCVKAYDRLAAAVRRHRPAPGTWVVHGFRGKPQLARQLLDMGLSLSLGHRFNPDTAATIPSDRLYHESDSPAHNHN